MKISDSWLAQLISASKVNVGAGAASASTPSFKVLELGSGTGLGGICMARLLEAQDNELTRDLTSSIFMSDICVKSLDVL